MTDSRLWNARVAKYPRAVHDSLHLFFEGWGAVCAGQAHHLFAQTPEAVNIVLFLVLPLVSARTTHRLIDRLIVSVLLPGQD